MKGKSKRIFSGATALIMVLAILTSGALAWYAGTMAINKFSGTKELKPMANLHDDFADPSEGGEIDKKIYVENTGNTSVFVRIKLTETWDIGGVIKEEVHMPKGDDVTSCCDFHDNFTWTMGNPTEDPYAYTSIKEGVAANSKAWDAQTEQIKATLVADGLGSATIAEVARIDLVGKTTNPTTPKTNVITMKAYGELEDKSTYVGWVYDVDGYAYWSKPLAEGEATGLLLSAVTVPKAGTMDYEYDIKVDMEFVDIKDIDAWIGKGSDGRRTIETNGEDNQMIDSSGDEGDVIKEGLRVGETTIEASDEAKILLRAITGYLGYLEVGDTFEDSKRMAWQVIADDKKGNVLIVAASVVGYSEFDASGNFSNVYAGSTLEDAMHEFYSNDLAPELKEVAQGVDFKGQFAWNDATTGYGLSEVDEAGEPTAFALSWQEADIYFGSDGARKTDPAEEYWLRSFGLGSIFATSVASDGMLSNPDIVVHTCGLRPALWIDN